jgi:signal transduction histidine kinase
MEAIGQLTGGIAHDFNNMLHTIGGSLELASRRIGLGRVEEAADLVDNARQTVERATSLTNRLLAFAAGTYSSHVPSSPTH